MLSQTTCNDYCSCNQSLLKMATVYGDSLKDEYWVKRWEDGTAYWHKDFVEPLLEVQ